MQQDAIVKAFGLPKHLASEIVAEQTQKALRTRWQAWGWLAVTLPLTVWLFFSHPDDKLPALLLFTCSIAIWHWIGRRLASKAIWEAARIKATRLNTGRAPH